jgi:hypothetical protein
MALSFSSPESAEPEEHLKQLLGVLMKHKEALLPLTTRYDCEFGYSVFTHDRPRFNFPADY